MLFISAAYAQDAAAAVQEPSALAGFMPIILILVVFYFMLIRPQQRKYKDHVNLVGSIGKGDTIVTSGGIIGKVTKVGTDANTLHVEIADGVEVKVIRSTVSAVLDANGQPVNPANRTVAEKPAAKTEKKPAAAKKATKAAKSA